MRRLVLALAALALVPGIADAKLHYRSLGLSTHWATSDGVRYAVFPTKNALVLVDAGSTKLQVKRLPLRTCPLAGGPPYYYVVGGGRIAVGCAYELFLRGFSGRQMVKPPYIERPGGYFDSQVEGYEGDQVRTEAAGKRWLEADVATEDASDFRRFLDWHTGESRSDSADAGSAPNLDDPALFTPLCAPLERMPVQAYEAPSGFYEYAYDAHFGVTLRAGPARGLNPTHELTIQACGQPEPQVLSGCANDCIYVQYGAGLLSWYDGELHLRAARTGMAYPIDEAHLGSAIAHTRRWLFVHRCDARLCRVLAARISR